MFSLGARTGCENLSEVYHTILLGKGRLGGGGGFDRTEVCMLGDKVN